MVIDIEAITVERLTELPDYAIVSLIADTNNYLRIIYRTLRHLTGDRNMIGAYVTATRPARAILSRLRAERVNIDKLYMVDCISYTVGGSTLDQRERVTYIESPTMLEGIMLKIIWLLKKMDTERRFVFFDSVNSLAIYNESKILSEFFHTIANKLRALDVFGAILIVGEQVSKDIENMLRLVSDETIDLRISPRTTTAASTEMMR